MIRPALARYGPRSTSLCALATLGGVLGLLALPGPPPLHLSAAIALGLGAACMRFAPRLLFPAVLGAAGFIWAGLHARDVLGHRWPSHAAGERVIAIATVESIPLQDVYGSRFDASLIVEHRSASRFLRARVLWPDNRQVRAGERWQVLLALYPPGGRLNAFARDSERQLFRERVHAVGRVVPSRLNVRQSSGHRSVAQLRERIARRIEARVADRDAAALIAALAVGHTGGMSREQWRVFNVTGTAHLVAISGLHVTLFAIVAIGMARIVWRVLAKWTRLPPRESFAVTLGLTAATGYSVLAGFSVPTQRTLIMLGAWFAARAVARHATLAMPIATALIVVLAIDPFAPLGAGFWLSFLAMTAIVLATGTRLARSGKVAEALRVQSAVALVLAPATLAWFGGVSLAGIGVNLVAIPVVSFVFVPLILLAVTFMPIAAISGVLLSLAAGIYEMLWPCLAASADVRHAMLFASPPAWWLACAAMAALFAGLPWPRALRIACVAWLVPLAASGRDLRDGELELTMLDTGQNAAVVARTAEHVLVHGIGEGFGTDGRSVENALLPFLRARAVERIDVLILHGGDRRSLRGLNALLANIDVDRIRVASRSSRFAHAAVCLPDERWLWDAIEFRVQTAGCEVQVSIGGTRVSLPDDAVVVRSGDRRRADLALIAGRTQRAGRTTAPAQRWRRDAVRVFATSSSGAITLHVGATGVERIDEQRAKRPRLWRVETG